MTRSPVLVLVLKMITVITEYQDFTQVKPPSPDNGLVGVNIADHGLRYTVNIIEFSHSGEMNRRNDPD